MPKWIATVLLLVASNTFMTFAWYYHVKHKAWPLVTAIIASWGLAFFEYCLQVPANRIGHMNYGGPFSLPQLKIIQEVITLAVFLVFTIWVAGEKPKGTDLVAFGMIAGAVAVAMWGRMNGAAV